MAGPDRTKADPVDFEAALERSPYGRHPFQVVRRLESLYQDKPRFGHSAQLRDDPVRFRQEPSLAFAPSSIHSFKRTGGDRPSELSLFSFGMFGTHGPLPLHLTEYAKDRLREGDAGFKRFVDIFHHRMFCLFYRAWADAQPTAQFDRPDEDRFGLYVAALAGLAVPTRKTTLPDELRRHYAGHFACPNRHPDGLRSLLENYFEVPVAIEEFVGHKVEIPEQCRSRLGASRKTGELGRSITLGSAIWQRQDRFRIVIGPLREKDYLRMLPPGESAQRLADLVRTYIGEELVWDVRLILRKEDVRPVQLGGSAQLGLCTWLITRSLDHDVEDFLMEPRG